MTREKKILTLLIDRLESKKHYYSKPLNEQTSSMKFDSIVNTSADNVSVSDYKMYDDFESAAKKLSSQELVRLKYDLKYNKGNIVRVDLSINTIDRAYEILNREPLSVTIKSAVELLKSFLGKEVWLDSYLEFLIHRIELNQSVKAHFDIYCAEAFKVLLEASLMIYKNSEELSYRTMSVKLFSDSKKLERSLGRLRKILEYASDDNADETDEMFFSRYNLSKNLRLVFLKGNLDFSIGSSNVSLGDFPGGISIGSDSIDSIEIKSTNISNVLTVENLTSFNEIEEHDGLIVYTGGFGSSAVNRFLKKIGQNSTACFSHWGDIDIGGMRILLDLREKSGLDISAVNMSLELLKEHYDTLKPCSGDYAKKAYKLAHTEKYNEFKDELLFISKHKKTLEQENIEHYYDN